MINLYLVPTPIGNIADMTFRSVDVLNNVDYIYSEDTRNTKVLLSHYNIKTPLKSYHKFNENERSIEIIDLLKKGLTVAVVSDAGYPGISDPGYLVAKKAIEEGFTVSTIPGATASLTALVTSGLPCERFYFYGFLAHTNSQKKKELESLVDYKDTLIFYESPHRYLETLKVILEVMGDRQIVIARELTKKYEEYIRGKVSEVLENNKELKGEMVIILEGSKKEKLAINLSNLTIEEHYDYYLNQGNDSKSAMKLVAKDRDVSKSEIYNALLKK